MHSPPCANGHQAAAFLWPRGLGAGRVEACNRSHSQMRRRWCSTISGGNV